MAISLTRFSWSWWGSGRKEKERVSNASVLNSSLSSEWDLVLMKETKVVPPHRKVRRSREERRVDTEYDDVVLVASDEGSDWCLSGFESDESDWSVGWLEPLGSDLQSVDDDDGFAVLVPCYNTPSCKKVEASNKVLLSAMKNLSNEFSSAGKNYMEQWLASLQKFEA